MSIPAIAKAMREAGIPDKQIVDTMIGLEEERLAKGRARQAKYRNSHKNGDVTHVTGVTHGEGEAKSLNGNGNGDVTDVTNVTRAPPETRPPTPPKTQPLSSPKENPPTGVKRKGSRITAEHRPNLDAAVAEGVPRHIAEAEARKFVDHFLAASGERGVKLDWQATWRNWFRRAAETRGIPLHDATGPPPERRVRTVEEIIAERQAQNAATGTG